MRKAVIVSAVRTALGSFNGSLAGVGATQLGAIVIEEAVKRAGIEKASVNEVIMGQVLPCGYGQNPAKQAAVLAGMPWEAECVTVNKVCGSALKAVMLAAQAIQTNDADVVVAGGITGVPWRRSGPEFSPMRSSRWRSRSARATRSPSRRTSARGRPTMRSWLK